MILHLIAVRDSAALVYGTVNTVPHIGSAVRSFGDEVNNPREGNDLYRHPGDFILYHFGNYDNVAGTFDIFPQPVQLARAVDFVNKPEVEK